MMRGRPSFSERADRVRAVYGKALEHLYTRIATRPEGASSFPTGRNACLQLGYLEKELRRVPESVIRSFVGVGYPLRERSLRQGQVVLDVGSGAGTDAYLASRRVGLRGRVWALDRTAAMLDRLCEALASGGPSNITPLLGFAEEVPLPDASVNIVISNGVLNMLPRPAEAFTEIFRVLRAGGRAQISDVVFSRPPFKRGRQLLLAPVRPLSETAYLAGLRKAGFRKIKVVGRRDYFSFEPVAVSRRGAVRLERYSIDLIARKPREAALRLRQRS